MKVKSAITLLLPTVQYGNIQLTSEVEVCSANDQGRIEVDAKRLNIKADKGSSEQVTEVARKLCVDEIVGMKHEIDKLTSTTFEHEKFEKKK